MLFQQRIVRPLLLVQLTLDLHVLSNVIRVCPLKAEVGRLFNRYHSAWHSEILVSQELTGTHENNMGLVGAGSRKIFTLNLGNNLFLVSKLLLEMGVRGESQTCAPSLGVRDVYHFH